MVERNLQQHPRRAQDRSTLAEVRNPVLALPAAREILAGPWADLDRLASLLRALSKDAAERAQKCWKTHKAPMALYWKCVAVYSGHISRALRRAADIAKTVAVQDIAL